MAKTNLKNYIEEHLSRDIYEGARDLESYRAANGTAYETKYRDAINKANMREKRAMSGYGSNANALLYGGLTNSGYAERINAIAEEKRQSEIAAAESNYRAGEDGLLRGYLGYLEDYREEQEKISQKATESIIEKGITTEEEAITYAKSLGLGEKRAKAAAARGLAVQRDRLITRAVTDVTRFGLTPERAKIYAASLGLDDNAMEYVALCAAAARDAVEVDPSLFEDYLEKIQNHSKNLTSKY